MPTDLVRQSSSILLSPAVQSHRPPASRRYASQLRRLRRTGGAGFRIVAGERLAENQQTERLVQRTITREFRVSSISKAILIENLAVKWSWLSDITFGDIKSDIVHFHVGDLPTLREENEKLNQEAKGLRSLLVKT